MQPSPDDVFTVTRLNREVRLLLEQNFGFIWLEGEISNLSRPASGHWYLTLKDQNAQIRCAMFRSRNSRVKFDVAHGDQVLVRGSLGLYEARGDFQLIIDRMEPVGEGALQRRFEQLREKLQAAGLFDEALKKPLPSHPRCIGVITSATGAAVRDVLHVLARRYPAADVVLYPTAVQGEAAAAQIAHMLDLANERRDADVLLLVRGGGSLEDLWSFNEEIVAQAIHRSALPVVSGVGHETDTTIADFVADQRAPTPSAAAELATPDIREERALVESWQQALCDVMEGHLQQQLREVGRLGERLAAQHPQRKLAQRMQRVDELTERLGHAQARQARQQQQALGALQQRLKAASPAGGIRTAEHQLNALREALLRARARKQEQAAHQLTIMMRSLHNVSPLATLERGYAVLQSDKGATISTIGEVSDGDTIEARVSDGRIACTVVKTTAEK
ncbi:exodeoxyribonuclease VII large subunit [Granulosicoccaceae sp. 1_MG-2023]|nr:exodeoxyribonuclease VII large subunit [Granulosicoccaceae sp. 1_MG-2023]